MKREKRNKRVEGKNLKNGQDKFFYAKDYINRGEIKCVLHLLHELLCTNYRLPAALELGYYYFQMDEYEQAMMNFDILLKEEKNAEIVNQVKRMQLYLMKKYNMEKLDRLRPDYYERQIIDYSLEEAIQHIKNNRIPLSCIPLGNTYPNNKFFYNFDLEKTLSTLQPSLQPTYALHGYDALDTYYAKGNYIGVKNDELSSTIRITTLRNTSNILDMEPVSDDGNYKKIIKISNPFDVYQD